MRTANEGSPEGNDPLPVLRAARDLPGSKDGKGIGELVDADTLAGWVSDYIAGQTYHKDLTVAFCFGATAEGRYAGQSFVEAEPGLRSEWSSEKNRAPWDTVRDAVWAGFDRARDRR